MWLDDQSFVQVISSTPLVSIDLIVRNCVGQVLLGKRLNRPAKGYWFVPGGRIRKDERIDDAFSRLAKCELGRNLIVEQARFLGVYQHLYTDNVFGGDVGTHYVVLAFELALADLSGEKLPLAQHGVYCWFNEDDLLNNVQVHGNTKDYFRDAVRYG